jgi:hypothetical protein
MIHSLQQGPSVSRHALYSIALRCRQGCLTIALKQLAQPDNYI